MIFITKTKKDKKVKKNRKSEDFRHQFLIIRHFILNLFYKHVGAFFT